MKRIFLLLSALVIINKSTIKAQAYEQNTMIASLGYGFINLSELFNFQELLDDPTISSFRRTGWGPIHARWEYALTDRWGFGVSINYAGSRSTWLRQVSTIINGQNVLQDYEYTRLNTNLQALIRINRHFDINERADIYVGTGIGYRFSRSKTTTEDPTYEPPAIDIASIFPIGFESVLGIRFLFNENIGGYFETGFGQSLLQFGAYYRFDFN